MRVLFRRLPDPLTGVQEW